MTTTQPHHEHHDHEHHEHHEHHENHGHVHHEHHHGPFHIVINGEEKLVHQKRLSFHEVCKLAFPDGPFGPNIVYTVTYTTPSGIERRMVEGDHVELENGMVFNVGNTDKS